MRVSSLESCRFDWYQATVCFADVEDLTDELSSIWNSHVVGEKPLYGYEKACSIRSGIQGDSLDRPKTVAKVLWGGRFLDPHVISSGGWADVVAGRLRERFPSHKVTRMDSRLDVNHPGAWDFLSGIAHEVAESCKVQINYVGDFVQLERGRTIYLGSMKSQFFIRIYEKGKQLGDASRPDWVRAELVVRPVKDQKARFARVSSADAWGTSVWVHEFAQRLAIVPPSLETESLYKAPDLERSVLAMVTQYGKTLGQLRECLGGWESCGKYLDEAIPTAKALGVIPPFRRVDKV